MLIDKYYSELKNKGINKVVVAPDSMIVENSEDEEGWVEWQLAKTDLDASKIKEIEEKLNITLPKDYVDFISDKQFMNIQLGKYTVYGINELDTLEKVASQFPSEVVTSGYFPIGNIDDGDYLALDCKSGHVLALSIDDFKPREVLFDTFKEFEQHLLDILVDQ
jgi:hypothetical protein